MQQINYTGWDIGGAHLKVASVTDNGEVQKITQYATPLWEGLDRLESVLTKAIGDLPSGSAKHALTMTAELVDIFDDRAQGVLVLRDLYSRYIRDEYSIYSQKKGLIEEKVLTSDAHSIGSANWHASGALVAQKIDSGIFIDIGSSTTDILPFAHKQLLHQGNDDFSRLRVDELVYTGVVRTPLMALANHVLFSGDEYGVAAELFATTADVYRILGLLDENTDMMKPADNGDKNVEASIRRLGRMIGADADSLSSDKEWIELANYFSNKQLDLLTRSLQRVISRHPNLDKTIVAAGAGVFLIKQLAQHIGFKVIEFSDLVNCEQILKDDCNLCAPAVALAELNRIHHKT